jgi:hypothetical protein
MDRPEIGGQAMDARVAIGIGQRSSIDITGLGRNNIIANALNVNVNDLDNELSAEALDLEPEVYGKIALSVAPRWELKYSSHNDNKISVKYQFYGDTGDKATKGNYSQAVSVGLAAYDDSASGLFTERTNTTNEDGAEIELTTFTDYDQDTYTLDVAWIHGYRLNDNFMFYGGPFFIHGKLDGDLVNRTTVTMEPSTGSTPLSDGNQTRTNLDSTGNMLGINVAGEYEFDFGMFVTLEVALSRLDWDGAKATDTSVALQFGYHF